MPETVTSSVNETSVIAKNRIGQIGKIIRVFCIVVRVISVALLVLALVGIAAVYAGHDFGATLSNLAGASTFVQIVDASIGAEAVPDRELRMINLFAFALSQAVLLAFISVLNGLVRDITENEKPFRVETAKQLRRNTFWLVLLMFWNILAGAIILLVSLLLLTTYSQTADIQND